MFTRVRPLRVASRRVILGILMAVSLFAVFVPAALADAPVQSEPATLSQDVPVPASVNPVDPGLSRRYGVASAWSYQPLLDDLSAGWFVDFGTYSLDAYNAHYMPVIRIKQDKNGCTYLPSYSTVPALTDNGLGALIARNPGAIWVIGNEPDRGPDPGECTKGAQDDVQPEMYARAFHDIYWFIRTRDNTARVASAGLVQITPGRLQYLDKVWSAYQRYYGTNWPVDMWNIHLYILPEVYGPGPLVGQPNGISGIAVGTDVALGIQEANGDPNRCPDPKVYCWAEHDDLGEFSKQIIAMRQWMKAHGQQAKPLILTEYSILYPYDWPDHPGECFRDEYGNCFTPDRVRTWMNRSMDWMENTKDPALGYPRDENRLLQRWLWFSIYYDGAGAVSSLADAAQALTMQGQNYQSRALAASRTHNLYPVTTFGTVYRQPNAPAGRTAALTADVRNAGSVDATGNVSVTFYEDQARTKIISTVVLPKAVRGCDGNTVRVTVNWTGLSVGTKEYWVVVDSGNAWAETDENDNVIKGTVFVGSTWNFLPLMSR